MAVVVVGLREFQAAVRRAAVTKPKVMREGLNEVGEVVVHYAIPLMESEFVTDPRQPRTGKLEGSVRAQSTAREGRVIEGYPSRVPYAGWWEFGGSTKRKAGGMNRTWNKRGRSLYPALDQHQAEVIRVLEGVLNKIADIINAG